ncbi:DUF1592 domain-containing protein [Luteolibacter sp. LG18]|uniref:DUF1592 domain-containing protein n=1 Tax=Luteolibacter sp. LG18 TaxID=2819286 RepID=UPI002B30F838|nr:hypothetical protein llg_34850 [Luteolibacter sp. LG18]
MLRAYCIVAVALTADIARADEFADRARPLLSKYCYECHGEKRQKGGIEVNQLTSTEEAFKYHRFLKTIADQVEAGKMPPEDDADDIPTDAERKALVAEIRGTLARLEEGKFPRNPGRPTVRRLNRNEYSRTVRDWLDVDFDAGSEFPADGAGGEGFDNVGDALFIQPSLMEKYLAASRRVIDAVYAKPERLDRVVAVKPAADRAPELAAKTVLQAQAALAFRRPPSDAELAPLLALFGKRLAGGMPYEEALKAPLQSLLLHPSFLFRAEHDEAGKKEWAVDGHELATRLSYFLWASMPDAELFRLAGEGKLAEPVVLAAQVKRMLQDPRAESLSRFFGGEWLGYDELLEFSEPDLKRFPEFTQSLRKAMYRESVEFFANVVRENRPATDLLSADYTFLNEELAKHYGIPDVKGGEMRKVALTDKNRGGVIGQASVMTVTSLPLRTSPVKRGKWILDTLLGTPPPPPPPDAGVLPPDDRAGGSSSMRERLENHRSRASCAACHAKIDPLGFGLENFDPLGRWRTTDVKGNAIDSKATLPGGFTFDSPEGLKRYLLSDDELFLRNLARKMLAYGLGRPLEYYDEPVVIDLVRQLRGDGLKIQSLITGIVQSPPFLRRSSTR